MLRGVSLFCFAVFALWTSDSISASTTFNTDAGNSENHIQIAVSLTPLSAPLFIAEELGLFTAHEVDVNLLPCVGGVECSTMLFNGRVDLATFSESVVMFQSFKRNDFSIISTFVRSDNDVKLLTLQKNMLNTVDQLIDKKVGVVKASSSEFFLDSMLISHSIPKNQVQKVFLKPEQLNNALLSGLVDAISVWEPWAYKLSETADVGVTDLSFRGVYSLSFNLCTQNSTLEQHSERYVKLLKALAESVDWINSNPELAKAILAKRLNATLAQINHVWDSYAFRLSLSNSLLSELQLQARWALEQKLVDGETPVFRDLINDRFLKHSAQEEWQIK